MLFLMLLHRHQNNKQEMKQVYKNKRYLLYPKNKVKKRLFKKMKQVQKKIK